MENPLIRQCHELTAKVAGGWTDGQYAAGELMGRAHEMAASLPASGKRQFFADLAVQVETASQGLVDTEVFELFGQMLRVEAKR